MYASQLEELDLSAAIIRDTLVIHPDLAVTSAVAQMSAVRDRCEVKHKEDEELEQLRQDARSSCLLVVEADTLVGIFTERDVVRLSANQGKIPADMVIRDAMTSPVIQLKQSEIRDPFTVLNLFWHHKIRHLPIVDDNNKILGIITHESLQYLVRPADMLRAQSVFAVMSSDVISASPNLSILEIAQLMAQNRVSSVVLTEKKHSDTEETVNIALGIITERDIVQFHALALDFEAFQASTVMSTPLFSVSTEASLWNVQQLMQKHNIRRIIVTGPTGELLGIVTQSSLLQSLNPLELARLIETLKHRVSGLEAEKIQILEQRTVELEAEVKARTKDLILKVEHEQLLAAIANDVRASLKLETVLQTAVTKVQSLLQCNRVAIWKMQPDNSVSIIAEAAVTGAPSNLGKNILDPCFDAPNWIKSYQSGQTRVVEDIYNRPMAECHRELLEGLNIRAKILVPILQNGHLWGIFSATESQTPRHWTLEEVALLRELSVQLSIAIQQAVAYETAQSLLEERQKAEARILHNALHDALTQLPNRTYILRELQALLEQRQTETIESFSILLLDLDRFKVINDSLGHHFGDQLLTHVAKKLRKSLREQDIAARISGDEFVVILRDLQPATVCNIAQRILLDFQQPIPLQGREIFVTTSIGIVLNGQQHESPLVLLRDADIAMYRAKSAGRNCYKIFDEAMYAQALRRLNLERELRQAIDNEEFVVYYQPIIDLNHNQLSGFEALVRWQHPELGFISPGEFIPLAEETGLITELTSWILWTACQQLATWKAIFSNLGHVKLSVNLSVHDLLKPNLAEEVNEILHRAKLESKNLTLEVTESLLIEKIDEVSRVLKGLQNLGISISIDDFGTGYSSLQYLSALPCDNLKIDRSFISDGERGDRNNQLVKIIMALSQQLNLASIAEGIETQQQLDWLRDLGCEFAQGYFFSKPLSSQDMEEALVRQYGAVKSAKATLVSSQYG